MAVSPECVAAVRTASGGTLNDAEAADLIRRMELRRDAEIAAGRLDGLHERVMRRAADDADAAGVEAAIQARNAALNAVRRDEIEQRLTQLAPAMRGDYRKAVRALLVGTTKAAEGARASVAATQLAFESRYHGTMMGRLAREAPETLDTGLLKDRAFQDDVVREMTQPGSTRNTTAQRTARILADIAETARQDANRLGAQIGRLENWAGPHRHDPRKLMAAGEERWVAALMPKLDMERTFPDRSPSEALVVLRDIYRSIVTGRDNGTTARERGEIVGPAGLGRSLSRSRVLHFSDAQAWLDYNAEFGDGHIVDAMALHLRRLAQANGLMEQLGPNPEALLGGLLESLQKRVRNSALPDAEKRKQIEGLRIEASAVANRFAEVRGETMMPVSATAASIGSGIRATQSMAKLGGAVISSISDLVTRASNLTHNGKPLFSAYADQLADLMQGRGQGEQRQIAFFVGEGYDGILDHINSAFHANDAVPGRLTSALQTFFRLTGLTLWTDANRAGQARMLSAWLGQHASKEFGRLPAGLQRTLAAQDITAARWDAIRASAWRAENGRTYVTPDRIAAPAASREAFDAELALRRWLADETSFGMIEADAASRSMSLQGTRPGTPIGEAARFIMQFKGYPIAFTQRVLGRAVQGYTPAERMQQAAHIGHLIAGTTIAGFMAMTAKDLLAGREPRDPTKWKTITAALMQSGGAGIYGDFLFGQVSRTGNGALETIAGPTLGATASLANLALKARDGDAKAGEFLNLAIQNTPFANLWYARPALDMLVLNSLREGLSPGFLRRQEEQRRKDFGQEYYLPRTLL